MGKAQFAANQGQEWKGIRATAQRRDFQVSKKGVNIKGLPKGM